MSRPKKPRALDWFALASGGLHPTKVGILEHLAENGNTPTSPNALAQALGIPLGVVSYHVRQLKDPEVFDPPLLELERTEPVRGALQHFYVLTEAAILNRQQEARRRLQRSASRLAGGEVELTPESLGQAIHDAAAKAGFSMLDPSEPEYRKRLNVLGAELLRGVGGA